MIDKEELLNNRGCLKSTPSLGLLSDNFCHLGDSQSINLPFETASSRMRGFNIILQRNA